MTTRNFSRIHLTFENYAVLLRKDPHRCRKELEALIADPAALRAYERLLELKNENTADHATAEGWLDGDLFRRIVKDGLRVAPVTTLRRLIRDAETLFSLQIEVLNDPSPYWAAIASCTDSLHVENQQGEAKASDSKRALTDPDKSGLKVLPAWDYQWVPYGSSCFQMRPFVQLEDATTCDCIRMQADKPLFEHAISQGDVDFESHRPLIRAAAIQKRVRQLGSQISAAYAGQPLMIVPVLTGGCFFALDLYRSISRTHRNLRFEPVLAQSYEGVKSKRVIVDQGILNQTSFEGHHVLIVDDILDTGKTLSALSRTIESRGPSSVRACVLLVKVSGLGHVKAAPPAVMPDYAGFAVPDCFVIGYGLDFEGRYRELKDIHVMPRRLLESRDTASEGIMISLFGERDNKPTALRLSTVEMVNKSPSRIEHAKLTVEFCAQRGWNEEEDQFVCKLVKEFDLGRVWDWGATLRTDVAQRDFDEALNHVRITFEGRINERDRRTETRLTRERIIRRCIHEPDRDGFRCEVVWPLGVMPAHS